MPVANLMQKNFTSGELDERLVSRIDIGQYFTSALKIRNGLVIPQGSVRRRDGLEYVDNGTAGGDPAFIVGNNIQIFKFVFSEEFQYTLILTAGLMRVYRDGIWKASIPNTITEDQIPDITFAQEYSTLLLFHQEFRPQAFIRQSDTVWVVEDWELLNIPTYNFQGNQDHYIQITDKATSQPIDFKDWLPGSVTDDAYLTRYNGPRATGGTIPFIDPDDIGRFLRTPDGGYARIIAISGTPTPGTAEIRILNRFRNNYDDNNLLVTEYTPKEWALEERSWGITNAAWPDRGWPACGTFFSGRLWVANTIVQPNTIWGSISGNRTDFQSWIPEFANNGIELTYWGGIVSAFHRLHAGKHLFILADTGEYFIKVPEGQPITPKNANIERNSSFGSLNLPVFEVDGNILFIRDGGKSLIESIYNYADGYYTNQDLSLLASHLLIDPKSITYRKQTNTNEADYILIVNADGSLVVLCTLSRQKVTAWTKSETQGDFIADGVEDTDMYFIVDRIIDGTPVRYLERFAEELLLDCGYYNKSDVPFDTIPYADVAHLTGEEVSIVLDNTIQPKQTVILGQDITLEREGYEVSIGLEFPIVDEDTGSHVFIESMPIETELPNEGITVGKQKRINEITLKVYETSHAIINKNKATIRQIGINPLDTPVPKITGNIQIKGVLGWDKIINISVGQILPLPFELLGMAYKVHF
jgi:hypothetical protein